LTGRHAPHVARLVVERIYAEDREYLEENLDAMREREGARLIRWALEEESNDLD
jgi:hypothetical protein